MSAGRILVQSEASASLLTELDSRDVAVWLLTSFFENASAEKTATVLGLPWAFVLSETSDKAMLTALETPEPPDSPLVRKRGMVHIIDTNPSDVTLPPHTLPVFLLSGRTLGLSEGFAAVTRRHTMLDELNRRSVKHLVILAGEDFAFPEELSALWADGFRSLITVVSSSSDAENIAEDWRSKTDTPTVGLIATSASSFADDLVRRYTDSRSDRVILRLRDAKGNLHHLDVTGLDDPEHPLFSHYELLTENHLSPLLPEDLKKGQVEGFFKDPSSSWRPFAAGMPWKREAAAVDKVKRALRRLDHDSHEYNSIFYVPSESGAGATTFVRDMAWSVATEGYPTLLAKPAPFTPKGLEVVSYMSRCLDTAKESDIGVDMRLYQAPWLIIFDEPHWVGRESELIKFVRQLEKSGRRACIVFVTGPYTSLSIVTEGRFKSLPLLTHQIALDEALELGRHLNPYLRKHGPTRSDAEWRNFFDKSAVGQHRGPAAFWIVLSFWLQRQFDMSETIQEWLYRKFRECVNDSAISRAIIEIAAMSTENQPLPEAMLPASKDWPTAQKLSDLQKDLGALGIVQYSGDTRRYWALTHDILGRYLLNALFYDHAARKEAGYEDALNPDHMRFLILKRLASMPDLGLNDLKEVANTFATTIFKIDPDHGRAIFAPFWREVLMALDEMPRALRSTSRTFLHHSAISRRRITKDAEMFPISDDDRTELLTRVIQDIETARDITSHDDDDSDLNLLNSLALAYHDLAEVEARRNVSRERIEKLREQARDATRKAYRLSPDNSFVIETYARDLLNEARSEPETAAGNAIEVLGIVYSSMQRDTSEIRHSALGRLADAAFEILMVEANRFVEDTAPATESKAIVSALKALGDGVSRFEGMSLNDYPKENRLRAAEQLANEVLQSNSQAVHLRYLLTCLDRPHDFALQLSLLEVLESSATTFTPQAHLDLAILLHQRGRHHEANRNFQNLRQRWRNEEHYVEVDPRLRWLLAHESTNRQQVKARVSASDGRSFAKVRELQDAPVPFRPQEFGQEYFKPGMVLNGLISFGHNGPFLRPTTAQ